MEQRLARPSGQESYDTWRADLADAGLAIDTTDDWPRIQRRLATHWERLGSTYARDWWARDWYRRLLDPRPCGWPEDDV